MSANLICSQCGTVGKPKVKNKGSIAVLLLLLLFFIVPGLIYLLWMASSRVNVCRKCKAHTEEIEWHCPACGHWESYSI